MAFGTLVGKILSALKVRSTIAGLEISDAVLRFASFNGKEWQLAGLRLPPGIIEGGHVKDPAQFIEALRALRRQIIGSTRDRRKISVAVSLSSVNIYSQVFSLPMIEGENLEKAIQLNIQMVSPAQSSETYAGWQFVGRDQKTLRLEILSAFIHRSIVDALRKPLHEAGFLVHSIESRALSLTRLLREATAGFDREQSYLALSIDSSGLEFLVIRKGNLYFQYFNSWRDIQGEERQISQSVFEAVIVKNLQQVLNFYNTHWTEPIAGIFLSASGLRDSTAEIIAQNFPLRILDFQLTVPQRISLDWFVALGSGFRNFLSRREDRDISLLGISAQEEFRRHQLSGFFAFWRTLVPVSLSLLLSAFIASDVFLRQTEESLKTKSLVTMSSEQTQEVAELQKQAKEFNRLTTLIAKAELAGRDIATFLNKVGAGMRTNGVTLRQFSFQGWEAPVLLSGLADSEEQILKFKKTLDENAELQSVTLPFSEIKPSGQGLSFSMSFVIASPKTE